MQVLLIQMPVHVRDTAVVIAALDNARPRLAVAGLVPLLMREDMNPVTLPGNLEVSDIVAIMKAGVSREYTPAEERMPFPKARTRRRDQHRFSTLRLRQFTAHGRPRFHRRQIG
jgi:hypothetical protein